MADNSEYMKRMKVQLDFTANIDPAVQAVTQGADKMKSAMLGTPQSGAHTFMGSVGGMGDELAMGQFKDLFRDLTKALEALTGVAKSGGIGGSGGSGGGPLDAPEGVGGLGGGGGSGLLGGLMGRNKLHSWEVQQLVNNPGSGMYGMMSRDMFAKAARIAMMPAGEAMASIGPWASAGLVGAAAVSGWKLGNHFVEGIGRDGESDSSKILADAGLAASTGVDIRGRGQWSKDRLSPFQTDMNPTNWQYVRQGLSGFGVHLGDNLGGPAGAISSSERAVYAAKNQIGADPSAVSGFMGAMWSSGSEKMNYESVSKLLNRIASATEAGKENGVTANETLQSLAGLMRMEDASGGAVSGTTGKFFQQLHTQFQEGKSDYLRGGKGADFIHQIGQNKGEVFRANMLNNILRGGKITTQGMGIIGKETYDHFKGLGYSDSIIAHTMTEDYGMKAHFGAEWSQTQGNVNPMAYEAMMGLPSSFKSLQGRAELIKGGWKNVNVEAKSALQVGIPGEGDAGLQAAIVDREGLKALEGIKTEIGNTAASIRLLNGILREDILMKMVSLNSGRALMGSGGSAPTEADDEKKRKAYENFRPR